MSEPVAICKTGDIPEDDARGFVLETANGERDIFIVRKNNCFYGYVNRCPHTGVNLEWQPHRFLNTDASLIQCSTHGARFRITDGFCIYGPCNGQSLVSIALSVDNGMIKAHGNERA